LKKSYALFPIRWFNEKKKKNSKTKIQKILLFFPGQEENN
jgi:hypothetical protein